METVTILPASQMASRVAYNNQEFINSISALINREFQRVKTFSTDGKFGISIPLYLNGDQAKLVEKLLSKAGYQVFEVKPVSDQQDGSYTKIFLRCPPGHE